MEKVVIIWECENCGRPNLEYNNCLFCGEIKPNDRDPIFKVTILDDEDIKNLADKNWKPTVKRSQSISN